MTTEELLIHELAERAGVSVRTIRYYIEEGLLPQPKYEGRYSYYKTEFLDRLELIRRLKDSYLPLREIREIMNSLTDEEVHKRLNELTLHSPKFSTQPRAPHPSSSPGAKALEYIDHVMVNQNKYRAKGTNEKPLPAYDQNSRAVFGPQIQQPEQLTAPANAETWQRVSLSPGVELHLRTPLEPATEDRVQQIVNFAKRIFHHKSYGGIK
ncbi:MAG: hypothetical protein A2136_07755 [Chloroflexi bacterium RBG_16_54_11]|nr:MAG: hypothetical protein A2136_07755 [Chloroflexi bacterium RBG_16_54_11]